MRWLILPDIHDQVRLANQIIVREPHDHLLLLADYFDDYGTGVTDAADTAKQAKQWLNSPAHQQDSVSSLPRPKEQETSFQTRGTAPLHSVLLFA
jgi:hypothetical protein